MIVTKREDKTKLLTKLLMIITHKTPNGEKALFFYGESL